jgi:outer membrane protein OmpA-like peptidoglycan-associated protein
MRIACLLAVALASRPAAAGPSKRPAPPPLRLTYDSAHLDLDRHVLQFKLSSAAASADLVVLGEDGAEIGTGSATYKDTQASSWLEIGWTQPPDTRVMILKLRVVADDGRGTNLELIPWSVAIDHEDVKFRTDSAIIDRPEEAKLVASLAKIDNVVKRSSRFMKMTLYVAGHTDTVGTAEKNRSLSLRRARAIASWFRRKGLAIPIAYAGYGEDVLKVKTAQETDAPANRRADYVIGPTAAPPPFKGPYLKARVSWQRLP